MKDSDPPPFWRAFWDGITMAGLFGQLGSTDPGYVRTAIVVAGFLVAALIGGCAYLVVKGHPVAAGGLLAWAVLTSLAGRVEPGTWLAFPGQ